MSPRVNVVFTGAHAHLHENMRRDYVVVPPNRRACTHTRAQPMETPTRPGLIVLQINL